MGDENPLNRALEPLELDEDEARELRDIIEHPRAFPTVPVRGIPRREASEMGRILCWMGYHRWRFLERKRLLGHNYTRYDTCSRCGEVKAYGERI